jgi:leader peptidase (prepilin peptidase)/N-methyltransferase
MPDAGSAAGAVLAAVAGLAAGASAAALAQALPLRPRRASDPARATGAARATEPDGVTGAARATDPDGATHLARVTDPARAAGAAGAAGADGWPGGRAWLRTWLRAGGWHRGQSLAAAGLTALIFEAWWLRFGLSPLLPALGYLGFIAVALAFIDARHRRLPDLLTLPSYPAAVLLLGLAAGLTSGGGTRLGYGLIGLAAALVLFAAQALLYPAGLGWGDVKLSGVLGLYLGWFGWRAVLAGLFGGYLLAAVAGIVLLASRRASRRSLLPFGPFLLAASVAAILIAGPTPGP